MSKDHFSIETDPQSDSNAVSFKDLIGEKLQLTGKSVSSSAVNFVKPQPEASFSSYRYEHVPDNEYTYVEEVQNVEKNEQATDLVSVHKLQAAYIIIGLVERLYARHLQIAFSSIVQSVSPEQNQSQNVYQSATVQDLKNQEVLKDFSNYQQAFEDQLIQTQTVSKNFKQTLESVQQRKLQILQRQRQGLTLDSLSRQRQSRSKSINRVVPEKDVPKHIQAIIPTQSRTPSEQGAVLADLISRQHQKSQVSRKSYREKYEEYKHRSQSQERIDPSLKIDLASFSRNHQTTQQPSLTRQINLKGTWNQTQGQNQSQNYSRFFYSFPLNSFGQYNELFSYKSPVATNLNSQRSNYHMEENLNSKDVIIQERNIKELIQRKQEEERLLAENEGMRAKLIEEMTSKLNFSRLRIEQRNRNQLQDLELIRKIIRLEKMVESLRIQQDQQISQRKKQTEQTFVPQQNNDELILKRFMAEFALIREQINELKLMKQSEAHHSQIIYETVKIEREIQQHPRAIENAVQTKPNYKTSPVVPLLQEESKTTEVTYKNFSESTANHNIVYKRILLDGKHEPYDIEQRELREQQIRQMTERVRLMRGISAKTVATTVKNSHMNQENAAYRPIREKYEQQIQKLRTQNGRQLEDEDNCCVLLEY